MERTALKQAKADQGAKPTTEGIDQRLGKYGIALSALSAAAGGLPEKSEAAMTASNGSLPGAVVAWAGQGSAAAASFASWVPYDIVPSPCRS